MEPRRDDLDLAAELRALRPKPRPEFAVELDRRAEAGFPRRERSSASLFERVAERLRTTPPRRLLVPAGALAVTAIVIATAIIATSDNSTSPPLSFRAKAPDEIASPVKPAPGGPAGPESQPKHANGAASAGDSSGTQYSEAPPVASEESQSGRAASGVQSSSSNAGGSGPFASHANHREIERAAQIVLGADPADVRGDAAKVFDAVHAADGIVLSSSISDAAVEAGARFDLLIPSGKLGDTLAAFSSIDEVLARHESTQDITAPTIGLGERLRDSRAKIEGLLAQLATTTTDAERTAVEAELRAERARAAALRSRLTDLSRRANLSRVSLRIETGKSSGGSTGGAWGLSDGLHDASRILAIAAGVTVVGLAIAVPLALLLLLLAWLAHRARVRSRREQALSRRV
ncbi:MAG TPA: DUF4349 domain-containing protein [Solirubrobacterales bacterium]|nr:DUF4349 domain-containing protein [Solirubrobacterales bacterium]